MDGMVLAETLTRTLTVVAAATTVALASGCTSNDEPATPPTGPPSTSTAGGATVTPQVLVPDLVGLNLDAARRKLEGAGLAMKVRGSGVVVSTDPASGSTVAPGSVVTLVARARG